MHDYKVWKKNFISKPEKYKANLGNLVRLDQTQKDWERGCSYVVQHPGFNPLYTTKGKIKASGNGHQGQRPLTSSASFYFCQEQTFLKPFILEGKKQFIRAIMKWEDKIVITKG